MDLQAFDRMLEYGVQCMDVPPLLDQALLDAAAEFYVGQRAADPFLDEIMTSQENFRKVFETLKTLDNPKAFLTEY